MARHSSIQRFRFLLLFILLDLKDVNTQQTPGHQLSPRTISTKYGAIRGAVLHFQNQQQPSNAQHSQASNDKSTNNGQNKQTNSNILQPVEFFLGVPYAMAPLGSLRFMPPVTPTFQRLRLAHNFGMVCPQKLPSLSLPHSTSNTRASSGNNTDDNQLPEARVATLKRLIPYLRNQSEDCLNLNIWMPFRSAAANSNKKLPVMVFIHGESYEYGTGNAFDGSVLASLGQIIVITINYRLNIFGFLPSVADGVLRGNYGLMDIIAALHYIQENIGQYGGNPNNVTLVGHGFGANCVHLLSLSPMAANLFHRIALMSGSALNYNAVAANSEMYLRHLTRALHCNQANTPPNSNGKQSRLAQAQLASSPNEILDCLRQKSVDELLRVDLKVPQHLSAFGPVQDNIVITLQPSILEESFNLLLSTMPGLMTSEHSLEHHMLVNPLYAFVDQNSFYVSDNNLNPNSANENGKNSNRTETGFNNLAASLASLQHLQPYDMLFGFTRVESPSSIFSAYEEKFGIDVSRRDRILRTLVRNLFDYHQQVILLTLINEYTDWSKPVEHPLNLLDSLKDILSDALVVSPLLKAADFNVKLTQLSALLSNKNRRHHHQTFASSFVNDSYTNSANYLNQLTNQLLNSLFNSGLNQPSLGFSKTRSFFYVFNYQSENSGYPQRVGCQSGEELPYLFGAPLAELYYPFSSDKTSNGQTNKRFSYFHLNYTKAELSLSEAVIAYWSNFVKFGDPNIWPHELDSMDNRVKHNFENVYWPQYDTSQRKYLFINMKPKIREHFHLHRLSYWLHLLPQLQRQADPILVQAMANSLLAGQPDNQLSVEQQQHVNELQQLFYLRYHLLVDHERADTYDGIVRPLNFKLRSTRLNSAVSAGTAHLKAQSLAAISDLLNIRSTNTTNGQKVTSAQRKLTNSLQINNVNNSTSLTSLVERSPYSMAIMIIVAIGSGFLFINLGIFVYVLKHQRRQSKCDQNGNVISSNSSNTNNRLLNTSSCSTSGSSSTNSTSAGVGLDSCNEKETLKRRRTNQALDGKIRNSFAILDSGNINSVDGDCQQCEKNNYILDDDNVKLTDQLLVAQLDQNALYATQLNNLNNAYLAQTFNTQTQPNSQWTTIDNEHLTSDNSSNHLLDNQIIVTTLRPSPKHCSVNCCDYSYQFAAPTVQFNPTQTNTSQSNYLTTNQTNPQQTNGQSQYVSQHYLVKNGDLQQETLT